MTADELGLLKFELGLGLGLKLGLGVPDAKSRRDFARTAVERYACGTSRVLPESSSSSALLSAVVGVALAVGIDFGNASPQLQAASNMASNDMNAPAAFGRMGRALGEGIGTGECL